MTRTKLVLTVCALSLPVLAAARPARAAEAVSAGPGRIVIDRGLSAEALVGSGINNRYGLGYGARLGYTFPSGVYVGGDVTRFNGEGAGSELLAGGDIGLRMFPTNAFELRPFAMVGAAIANPGTEVVGGASQTQLAVQPGLLAAYHFGRFFVSSEARLQVLPTPAAASLLGGAGLTF